MRDAERSPREAVRVLAPAKLNLFLEVLGRRPDGYHELVTTMLALELDDRIELRPSASAGIRLSLGGPQASADIPLDERNLVVAAAARGLERARASGRPAPTGLEIELEKHIPSQAGLGGGSSDAAACLLALEALLPGECDPEASRRSLSELGSDCVFFSQATTGSALCQGRGELVRALPAPAGEWFVALITPELRCPTGAVFAALEPPLARPTPDIEGLVRMTELGAEAARAQLFNRLERAARRALPELEAWFDCLAAARASHFRLSGSGSSLFGLYSGRSAARDELDRILGLAAERSLNIRGSWVLKPARRGVVRI